MKHTQANRSSVSVIRWCCGSLWHNDFQALQLLFLSFWSAFAAESVQNPSNSDPTVSSTLKSLLTLAKNDILQICECDSVRMCASSDSLTESQGLTTKVRGFENRINCRGRYIGLFLVVKLTGMCAVRKEGFHWSFLRDVASVWLRCIIFSVCPSVPSLRYLSNNLKRCL